MAVAAVGNKALMPREFRAGLSFWSRTDGTPNSPNWAGQTNAAVVPADEDFGSCLEILKLQDMTSLRYMQRTPISPGTYLRISTRVKAIAGNLPNVRIAAFAGDSSGAAVPGLLTFAPAVSLTGYGNVVEVSAIVGSGRRDGVDMPWGRNAAFGYFGLDLMGDNNGSVRIENFVIEDVTAAFMPGMLDWVDVRDFGALGNGVADDRAAFVAANQAAGGGQILVPQGTYFIGSDLSLSAPTRFTGTLRMPRNARLALTGKFDFSTYASAFGDETEGMKRALQALFGFTDHSVLDLNGRVVHLTEPMTASTFAPGLTTFANRRVITNGQIAIVPGPAWATRTVGGVGTYNPNQPLQLSGVSNIANIEIGSRISGNGVGREVYVNGRNIGAGTLSLSQPLFGGAGTRSYTFTRNRYAFDFSEMEQMSRLNFDDVEFLMDGEASGVMLSGMGSMNTFRDCYFTRPKDRGITSIGTACQGMTVDRCEFLSNELGDLAQNRTSIGLNVNANDTKIRHNRFVRFGHFMVAGGGGHIIEGNHWFQGDAAQNGVRFGGLILTQPNVQATVTGNYIDNCSIEWTNEHDPMPNFVGDEYSFGGLTVTGNTFLASNTTLGFNWLVVKPYGSGHFIHGLAVMGNVFKSMNNKINRIDRVDTTFAQLDYTRMRNVQFQGNMFNGVLVYVANPVDISFTQGTAANRWIVPVDVALPFNGWAKNVESLIAKSAITNAANQRVTEMPWVQSTVGTSRKQVALNWSGPARGSVSLRVRMDDPI
ncbi:glycosyl hydrolase family 28-related protein [Paracoccus shanxieyensis]|uniref:Right-handed parallel beta-helix repeat-containing protein n=1 Tax=Paracoccus shanxieyensis TaxID=2675752 RepID=A0A6L6IZ39_9RHOB|nr:glycosyl hydrolase family 28-related protein [Paracoccus shanxieyensis]MTH63627.1 right-handed parallel beta-helix repeat-containing protein [Paracoccus shanxieyensis]MTH86550.1 right-handed parallel beta-helix repeat-containing protein [Paracoccus shanxieyensis]